MGREGDGLKLLYLGSACKLLFNSSAASSALAEQFSGERKSKRPNGLRHLRRCSEAEEQLLDRGRAFCSSGPPQRYRTSRENLSLRMEEAAYFEIAGAAERDLGKDKFKDWDTMG